MRTFPTLLWMTFVCAIGAFAAHDACAATALVDTQAARQLIRGFGGATVFQPPGLPASLSPAEMDTLFENGPGQLGFTILRIRVAADDAWRAVELAHAQGAIARGAIVMATPWSPPASMKSNSSLIDGSLLPGNYAAYATYLDDFARYMAANGAPLYAISVQNEPDINVPYESCEWTPEQMLDFCHNNAGAITATRVIAPESFQFLKNMSDPILNDAVATENIDIIGGHIYGGGLADYPLARAKDKEVWMTEHLDSTEVPPAGSKIVPWLNTLAVAKEIHDCLATANFNAYIWWYLKRFYGPLGEDSVVTKRGYIMAQFSKFIRPGCVRIDASANPNTGVYVSAYKKDKIVIVAVNLGTGPVVQDFSIAGATVTSMDSWRTSETVDLQPQSSIAVTAGSFAATLPGQSVTTFVSDLAFAAPVIVAPPHDRTVAAGSTLVLDVTASGEQLSYQWNKGGIPIPGATTRLLTITGAQSGDAGSYTVTVSNSGGSVTSAGATVAVAVTANPGRLVNISTRSPVGTGNNVQIGGFVITGSTPKQVLVRAAGPALNVTFGLNGVLADPRIDLQRQSTGELVASNDDWTASLAPTFVTAGAFGWTAGSKDAALVAALDPGAYTAVIRGADGGTGNALVEVYDISGDGTDSRLVNISTRSLVNTGDNVQIGGFYIAGTTAKSVVIRASGPGLNSTFGLNGVVADPVIELHAANGDLIATNDDWGSELASHFNVVGAFPWNAGSRDAAIVTSLNPGGYTVIVRGKNGGTGVALVEIYGEN